MSQDGVIPVWFRDGGNSATEVPVTIPPEADQVFMRFFTTGHGAVGASNCDEFCQRFVALYVDGVSRFQTPAPVWRTDCTAFFPGVCPQGGTCTDWNACGCPSCAFSRAGWCPGSIACHHNEPCDQDVDITSFFPTAGTYDLRFEVRNMTAGAAWANSVAVYWYDNP